EPAGSTMGSGSDPVLSRQPTRATIIQTRNKVVMFKRFMMNNDSNVIGPPRLDYFCTASHSADLGRVASIGNHLRCAPAGNIRAPRAGQTRHSGKVSYRRCVPLRPQRLA